VEYGFKSSEEYSKSASSSPNSIARWSEYVDLYSKYSDFPSLPNLL
jgi:hypothetical protein